MNHLPSKKFQIIIFFFCSFCFCLSSVEAQNLLWKFKTADRVYSSPAIAAHALFIGSGDHHLYALDKKDGRLLWKFQTGGAVHSSPLYRDGVVYASSADAYLYAVDAKTGKLIWKFASGGEKVYDTWDYYLSSPVADEDRLYWGSGDGHIYALQAATGKLLWQAATGDVVHADAAVDSTRLYIGSFDGYFYCLNKYNGELIWKFNTLGDAYFPKGEVQKAALIKNGTVYFGSRDYNIYALDAATGVGRWNQREKFSWIVATPFFYKDNIYFGTSDSHAFYALGAGYGEDRWKLKLNMRVYGSAVAHDSLLYFGCFNGKLYGVSPDSGIIRFQFQTEGSKKNFYSVYDANEEFRKDFKLYGDQFMESEKKIHTLGSILCTPAVSDDVIYFGSSDGYVYAVKLKQ